MKVIGAEWAMIALLIAAKTRSQSDAFQHLGLAVGVQFEILRECMAAKRIASPRQLFLCPIQ